MRIEQKTDLKSEMQLAFHFLDQSFAQFADTNDWDQTA